MLYALLHNAALPATGAARGNPRLQRARRRALAFIAVAGLLLFAYTAYRAGTISFTHDESYTYLNFRIFQLKVLQLQHVENVTTVKLEMNRITGLASANTHLLNTLLMMASSALFGDSELALRLPNVLAHLLYIVYSLLIVRRLRYPLAMVCGWLLLNTNPFVLDFFSVARGYGLAVTFMLMSVYYYLPVAAGGSRRLPAYLCGMAAVYANFTLLNFYLALLLADALVIAQAQRLTARNLRCLLRQHRALLGWNAAFLAITMVPVLLLHGGKQLYAGSSRFWMGSLYSLVADSLYQRARPPVVMAAYLLAMMAMVLLAGRAAMAVYRRRRISDRQVPLLLLLCSLLLCIAQHLLLQTPYPESRTGLYLVVLFVLALVLAGGPHKTGGRGRRKVSSRGISGLQQRETCFRSIFSFPQPATAARLYSALLAAGALLSLCNFLHAANFRYALTWAYDAHTKEVFRLVQAQAGPAGNATLYADWLFEPALNYYRVSRQAGNMPQVSKNGQVPPGCRYFYYCDTARLPVAAPRDIVVKEIFPDTGTRLAVAP